MQQTVIQQRKTLTSLKTEIIGIFPFDGSCLLLFFSSINHQNMYLAPTLRKRVTKRVLRVALLRENLDKDGASTRRRPSRRRGVWKAMEVGKACHRQAVLALVCEPRPRWMTLGDEKELFRKGEGSRRRTGKRGQKQGRMSTTPHFQTV